MRMRSRCTWAAGAERTRNPVTMCAPALFIFLAYCIPAWVDAQQPVAPGKTRSASIAGVRRPTSAPATDEAASLAWIDESLQKQQFATALERIADLPSRLRASAAVAFRAARAHAALGNYLGATTRRTISSGSIGQIHDRWMLISETTTPGEFVCCPAESALFQIRRAIDGGLAEPLGHLLHAQAWLKARRPEVALDVLRAHEDEILNADADQALQTFSQAAMASGEVNDYLRYERRRAERAGARKNAILLDAYAAAAEIYNQRGIVDLHREYLRRALELSDDRADLMLQFGDALWEAGALDDAGIWYRKLLAREPLHPARVRLLERLDRSSSP